MPIVIGNIRLFSLDDLSEALGVTTTTLRGYISKGKLKARKMGGKFFVSEDALREYFTTIDEENLIVRVQGDPESKARAGKPKKNKEGSTEEK
jgi:excisionase family DNA binding protein